MTENVFDQACRYLLRICPVPLLSWLLRLTPNRLDFVGWLDTRALPWPGQPDRTCDTVAHLRDPSQGGVPWAVPVEFQTDPDPRMFGRGMVYLGHLWEDYRPAELRGDRFEVGLMVVNLRGRGRCSRRMRLSETKLLTALGVVERNLSGLSAAKMLRRIESGSRPAALLPWIPLFQGGNEAGIIAAWVELARRQTDADVVRVLPLTPYFAEAAGCVEAWREAMKGWDVIKSQVWEEWQALALQEGFNRGVKEGVKEGKKEGIKEGIKEGQHEGKVDALLRILRRMGAGVPSDLEQAIRSVADLDRLDAAIDAAVSVASLEDFRRTTGL